MNALCPKCEWPVSPAGLPVGRHPLTCIGCRTLLVLIVDASGHAQVILGFKTPPGSGRVSRAPIVEKVHPVPLPAAAPAAAPPGAEGAFDIWDRVEPADMKSTRRSERLGSGPRSGSPGPESRGFRLGDLSGRRSDSDAPVPGPRSLATPFGPATGAASAPAKKRIATTPLKPEDVPEFLGGYRVVEPLDVNDQCTIFSAIDPKTAETLELLIFHPSTVEDASLIARLAYAAHLAAQLDVPNLIRFRELGREGNLTFVAVEGVVRRTLAQEVRKSGPLPAETAIGFALQACEALGHLHRQGIVHRLVNPHTLLLDAGSVVKISDWGSVRTVSTGRGGAAAPFASQHYLAPELFGNSTLRSPPVDVYALGCTLYTLLAGEPPAIPGLGAEQGSQAPKSASRLGKVASLPAELIPVLERATAPVPADRYPSIEEFAEALRAWANEHAETPALATEEETVAYARLARRYSRLTDGSLAWLFAVALLIGSIVLAVEGIGERPHAALAVIATGWAAVFGATLTMVATSTSELAISTRKWVYGLRWFDGLTAFAVFAMLAYGLALGGFFGILLAGIALGAVAGGGCGVVASGLADRARRPMAPAAREIMKALRRRGLDESAVRTFAVEAGGRRWEPLFRRLFGARAAGNVRTRFGGRRRQSLAAAACDLVAGWLAARERAATRAALRAIQTARFLGHRMAPALAKAQAKRVVDEMMRAADRVRESVEDAGGKTTYRVAFDNYAHFGKSESPEAGALAIPFWPQGRLLLGSGILACALAWLTWSSAPAHEPPPLGQILFASEPVAEYGLPWMRSAGSGRLASVNSFFAGSLIFASALLKSNLRIAGMMLVAVVALTLHHLITLPGSALLGGPFVGLFFALVLGVCGLLLLWDSQGRNTAGPRRDNG